jgi:hypothetical protein
MKRMSASALSGHAIKYAKRRFVPRPDLSRCSKIFHYPVELAASTILGSRIVKVEPRPGSLSTVMSPPII